MNKLPNKPIDATWTDEQWKAIYSSEKDILVAAAAGSGKTAVLVERIIQKVINEERPININEILVVTFTKASAAEMKHRIAAALEESIENNPTSIHLKQQLNLLNQASISTLHSFCQEVIRQNYYKIELDPNFRLADETEIRLIKDEIVETIFETMYERANEITDKLNANEGNVDELLIEQQKYQHYFENIDFYTNDRNDVAIKKLILKIYEFINANTNPMAFLEQLISEYDTKNLTTVKELPFYSIIENHINLTLQTARKYLLQAINIIELDPGQEKRLITINSDLTYISSIEEGLKYSWKDAMNACNRGSFERIKGLTKKDEYDEALEKQVKNLRDSAKDIVTKMIDDYFVKTDEQYLKEMDMLKGRVEWIVSLVKQFHEQYKNQKEKRGILDFSDLEHLCLAILIQNGELTDVARMYKHKFKEVLVDEYQDTNFVQEAILEAISKGPAMEGNRFMVGDVKQSIYKFRLAEPRLFLGKYQKFTNNGENTGLKIDLAKNFRSREEILHGTNYIFKQIMNPTVGEINYDDDAELKIGASYPNIKELRDMTDDPTNTSNYDIELVIIETADEKEVKDVEEDNSGENQEVDPIIEKERAIIEAKYIAKTIKERIDEGFLVYDGKKKSARPMEYRDVVILLRSMSDAMQIVEVLKQEDIPAYANLSKGYFESIEVSLMMDYLSIIDNSYQDIPLAGILRSPIVGITENELALIRNNKKNITLMDCLHLYSEEVEEINELREKILTFLNQIKHFRNNLKNMSLSELIWDVYKKTDYYDYVGGLPSGKQRQANLRALYDRSLQYETTSFRGLFNFLQFIKMMKERGDDLGTAKSLGEQENVVRIMTIHSSKGLEFPVVFVANMTKQFNTQDLKAMSLLDKDFGMAVKVIDLEKRTNTSSIFYHAIREKLLLEMKAEEMRILYVALTRAKEKLYLVGTVGKLEKLAKSWQIHQTNSEWLLDDFERMKANSYLDWVGPSVLRHKDAQNYRYLIGKDISANTMIQNHPSKWKVSCLYSSDLLKEVVEEEKETKVVEHEPTSYLEEITSVFTWQYPFIDLTTKRAKQSVTEIKKNQEMAASGSQLKIFRKNVSTRPSFMQEKNVSRAERGTAMHLVMQMISFKEDHTEESVERFIKQLVDKGLLTDTEAKVVSVEQIIEFMHSELGRRMRHANYLEKEVPFSLAVPLKEVYLNNDLDGSVLVQGIIDCLFEEDGNYVIVDFKTDHLSSTEENKLEKAVENHRIQLNFYKMAVERIFNTTVQEMYIYFFDKGIIKQL